MNKIKYALVAGASTAMGVLPVLAEGEANTSPESIATQMAGVLTPYASAAQTAMVTILTAGAVIVGGFFIWRVLKRALGASK